jgi:hypothetical protein
MRDQDEGDDYKWLILEGIKADSAAEARLRFEMQFLSDVYKAIQSRLDGYRQSTSAIFLAVVASALTFDSIFARFFVEKPADQPGAKALLLASGVTVIVICFSAFIIIDRINYYFTEMTSIILKMDEAHRAFRRNYWFRDDSLFPESFRAHKKKVSVSDDGFPLYGWEDPVITIVRGTTAGIGVLHVIYYAAIWFAVYG